MADRLATVALQEYVGPGNLQLTSGTGIKRVWFVYTQEKGGQKLRITGELREMLKSHIKFRHHSKYLETSQASHIIGQGLHLQVDLPLLKKIWKPADSCSEVTA